ncbi:MAG: histidine kinase N-terminal 7TM domain-containing protein, partial [Asticcacaulis sp.]
MNDVATGETRRQDWLWLWRVLAMVWAVFVLEQDVENLMWSAQVEPGQGRMGAAVDRAKAEHGYMPVLSAEPGGPFANAGIVAGDRVRFDHTFDYAREKFAGETIGLSVIHDGHERHTVITAAPPVRTASLADILFSTDMLNGFTCIIAALFGLFILWRGGGRATSLLLGMGFVTFGMATALPQLSLSSPAVFMAVFAIGSFNYGSIPILFYAFALRFFSETIHPLSRRHWWFFSAYAAVQYACTFCLAHYLAMLEPLPLAGNSLVLSTIITYAGFAFSFVYLMRGWRRSSSEVQQRYALMLIAISAIILSQIIVSGAFFLIPLPPKAKDMVIVGADVLAVISPLLFSYSIFRHRVLDLG